MNAVTGARAPGRGVAEDLRGLGRVVAIGAVLAALALVVLSAAMVNVALPTLAIELHTTAGASVRVVSAYQLGLAMALLPSAALGESRGHRLVFAAGIALFAAASGVCALAPNLQVLIAARWVQGLGGAAVMALAVAQLRTIVAREELPRAIAWNTLTVALASAAAPALGSLLLSTAHWRAVFALYVPLGVLALVGTRALPAPRGTGSAVDPVSVALNAAVFGLFVTGAELLRARAALGLAVLVASALSAAALVQRESAREAPMLPVDLLQRRSFRRSALASILGFVGQSTALVALPFYLRHHVGHGLLVTGLLLTAWPLSVALVAPFAGRLAERAPSNVLCGVGASALSAGLMALALWPARTDSPVLVAAIALCGAGFGVFQVSNNRTLFLSAPHARSAAAGGLQGTARLTGQTLGAVATTVLFARAPITAAPSTALVVAAAFTLGAALASAPPIEEREPS